MSRAHERRLPVGPLLALFPDRNATYIAARIGMEAGTWRAIKQRGTIPFWRADRIAVKLGHHPVEIWGYDWYEVHAE